MPSEIIYSVFVSSTYDDLREERAAVQKALLQLHCMPIGMELFGSADEETWDFIKRQITNCDYYIAILADKYGSTANDGISYTEKEYDYARKVKKPVISFIHADRDSLPRNKTETDPKKRSRLEAFIKKVRRRSPVSFFTAPHDLATQVTVSFVNLRDRRSAVGFIRADQAPDLKKYTELLEENTRLQKEVSILEQVENTPFPEASDKMKLPVTVDGDLIEDKEVTWGELFRFCCESILVGHEDEVTLINDLRRWVIEEPGVGLKFDPKIFQKIKFRFVSRGLIEVIRTTAIYGPIDRKLYKSMYGSGEREVLAWKLTSYGLKQYGVLTA
jgi:Domain of unknown function (DUF4062)